MVERKTKKARESGEGGVESERGRTGDNKQAREEQKGAEGEGQQQRKRRKRRG
jgi:hypothetical protein